jgi:hypothetical protein
MTFEIGDEMSLDLISIAGVLTTLRTGEEMQPSKEKAWYCEAASHITYMR